MVMCKRRGCGVEFQNGRYQNEYCCGHCRNNRQNHSEKGCTKNKHPRTDWYDYEEEATRPESKALLKYDERVPVRYRYQHETVFHVISLLMGLIKEDDDARRSYFRKQRACFHPDVCSLSQAMEITQKLNCFAEWYLSEAVVRMRHGV